LKHFTFDEPTIPSKLSRQPPHVWATLDDEQLKRLRDAQSGEYVQLRLLNEDATALVIWYATSVSPEE
jgi:hypothetical protein